VCDRAVDCVASRRGHFIRFVARQLRASAPLKLRLYGAIEIRLLLLLLLLLLYQVPALILTAHSRGHRHRRAAQINGY